MRNRHGAGWAWYFGSTYTMETVNAGYAKLPASCNKPALLALLIEYNAPCKH